MKMTARIPRISAATCLATILATGACGTAPEESTDDTSNGNNNSTPPACRTSADCADGWVCLSYGAQASCAATCTGSATECGASATCGGVGALDIDVCQTPPATSTTTGAPDPEEQPRVPCASDAECAALQPGAICATYAGARDCTIPCTLESDCSMPAMGGVSIDFLTCIPDQGQTTRTACLPDSRCFNDVMACVSIAGTGGGGGGGTTCDPIGAMCSGPSQCCSDACAFNTCCVPQAGACTTDADCCETGCYEQHCCVGPAGWANQAVQCCAGLSYDSSTGTCCVATGSAGCHADGDCCGWTDTCINGTCQ